MPSPTSLGRSRSGASPYSMSLTNSCPRSQSHHTWSANDARSTRECVAENHSQRPLRRGLKTVTVERPSVEIAPRSCQTATAKNGRVTPRLSATDNPLLVSSSGPNYTTPIKNEMDSC